MRLFILVLFAGFCDNARILGVFNHPGASHTFLGKVLLKNLAKRGHDVVMISSFPMEESIPNYKDILLPELLEDLKRREMMLFKSNVPLLQNTRNMSLQHTEDTFKNPEVQKLLNSNQTFDVIIIDWFYNTGTLMFGHVFKAPVIYMSSFGNNFLMNPLTGNSLPWSYVPGLGFPIHDDIPFKYRVYISLGNIIYLLFRPNFRSAQHEILKRHFSNPPTIEELEENVALVLSMSHFSMETPRPYTSGIIPVGGFHVEEPAGLPRELKQFLDISTEGVVYFNLGSQIKSSNLEKSKIKTILKVFSTIPQKVLWKYEEDLENLPNNVKLINWAPQLEILGWWF